MDIPLILMEAYVLTVVGISITLPSGAIVIVFFNTLDRHFCILLH